MPPEFETAHDRIVRKVTRAVCELHLSYEKNGQGPPSYESIARVSIMYTKAALAEEGILLRSAEL
jgi:hypothetical protein